MLTSRKGGEIGGTPRGRGGSGEDQAATLSIQQGRRTGVMVNSA